MQPAGPGTVHVSWGRVDALGAVAEVASGYALAAAGKLLSEDELARAAGIPNMSAKRQFIAGRVLLRKALEQATGIAPEALRFRYGERGKPFLPGGPPFSLSHSGDQVVVAVGTGSPAGGRVGVDVEVVRPVRRMAAVAERRFAPEEAAWWANLPPGRRTLAFFQLWTLKEAFAKAVGGGLVLPGAAFAARIVEGLASNVSAAGSGALGAGNWRGSVSTGPLARVDLSGEEASRWSVGALPSGAGVAAAVAADWPQAVVVEAGTAAR